MTRYISNPFTPGSGLEPRFLAGRQDVLNKCYEYVERIKNRNPSQAIALYGLRGVGKTVILKEIAQYLEANHPTDIVIRLELDEQTETNFRAIIFNEIKGALFKLDTKEQIKTLFGRALKLMKSVSLNYEGVELKMDIEEAFGEADSGDFSNDLKLLFIELGKAAKAKGRLICFLLDEVQTISKPDLAALLGSIHRLAQDNLPIAFVLAGLPNLLSRIPDAKTYGERYRFLSIDRLSTEATYQAFEEPIVLSGRTITPEAKTILYKQAQGYPYFIQQFGEFVWNESDHAGITSKDAYGAIPKALQALDQGFYNSRFVRSTPVEREFMHCMATLGKGPYAMDAINKCLGKKANQTSQTRIKLIDKGFIYAVAEGQVDFTVPLFDEYLKRNHP